jgi:hypothetical protein
MRVAPDGIGRSIAEKRKPQSFDRRLNPIVEQLNGFAWRHPQPVWQGRDISIRLRHHVAIERIRDGTDDCIEAIRRGNE